MTNKTIQLICTTLFVTTSAIANAQSASAFSPLTRTWAYINGWGVEVESGAGVKARTADTPGIALDTGSTSYTHNGFDISSSAVSTQLYQSQFLGQASRSGFANSSVDATTGQMRWSIGQSSMTGQAAITSNLYGQAQALIRDTITFNNSSGAMQLVSANWLFHGQMTPSASNASLWSATSSLGLQLYSLSSTNPLQEAGLAQGTRTFGAVLGVGVDTRYNTGEKYTLVGVDDPMDVAIGGMDFQTGILDIHGSYSFLVPTGISQLGFVESATTICDGFDCNFGNTAKFGFTTLPAGVSFTSASGVFLTAAPIAQDTGTVPVPATGLLMLLGLLAPFAIRRVSIF
jgi:hypothetical protein